MHLTLRDVYAALDYGSVNGGESVVFTGVSTDTRTLQLGNLFVALLGPQTDGHQHIAAALRAGAAGLIVSQNVVASPSIPVLRVPDTQVAYGLLARFWRDQFDIPVVGVTGSVGKTTVKEMLAAALSPLGSILKTAASQNNETGVPKALLQLTSEHKAAVVEMGMRGSGQIAYLVRHRPPDSRRRDRHRRQPLGAARHAGCHRRRQRRAAGKFASRWCCCAKRR